MGPLDQPPWTSSHFSTAAYRLISYKENYLRGGSPINGPGDEIPRGGLFRNLEIGLDFD
jgi:hypothetical protein